MVAFYFPYVLSYCICNCNLQPKCSLCKLIKSEILYLIILKCKLAYSVSVFTIRLSFYVVVDENNMCVALARVGSETQRIASGTLHQIASNDLGPPLHCLIVVGNVHPVELDMLKHFSVEL